MMKHIIRSIQKTDIKMFVDAFKARGWYEPSELIKSYFNQQETRLLINKKKRGL